MPSPAHSTPYRLAAIDIDGTLLGPDSRVSSANIAAVAALRDHGIRVVLASGRRHENILHFHRQLNLEGPIVSCQGALVKFAESGVILDQNPIPADLAEEVVKDGLIDGMTLIYYGTDGIYIAESDSLTELYHSRGGDELILFGPLKQLSGHTPLKIIWMNTPAQISARFEEIAGRYRGRLDLVVTYPEYLEFLAHKINKAVGIAAVANYYGINREEVVSFGDGNNDVSMLEWAGVGVAMSNSTPSAKAAAAKVASQGPPETSLSRAIAEIISNVQPESRVPSG